MNTKYLIGTVLLSIALLISNACDTMLQEKPKTFVNPKEYYRTEGDCRAAVNYLYTPFYSLYRASMLFVTDLTSDLSYISGSTFSENNMSISPASPSTIAIEGWKACYSGIMQANNVIAGINASDTFDDDTKLKFIAEAAGLRAFYYYILTELFNDVPFYTDPIYTVEDQNRIAQIPRMSAVETRKILINDLKQYIGYIPVKSPEDPTYQYISRQFIHMLIAKMAMKNRDYAEAKEHLLKIREIYGPLNSGAYPVEDILFSRKNSPETIFEVQYLYDPTGIQRSAGVSIQFMPPLSDPGTDIFDGVHIPFIGKAASTSNPGRPTNYFINLYDKINTELAPSYYGEDPRKAITIAYGYNGEEFESVKRGGKPFFGIKFWTPDIISFGDGNNQPVFRYADAVLMLAECYNEEPERDADKALEMLKEVRQRAGYVEFFKSTDKKRILKEIQEERARELFGEYQRKFDLVRWGIWYDQIKMYSDLPQIRDNVQPYYKYLPIPDTEVMRTNGILTNEDYQ